MRRRYYAKEDLLREVPLAISLTDLCRRLGLKSMTGSTRIVLRRVLTEYGIDTKHFSKHSDTKKKNWTYHLVKGQKRQPQCLRRCLLEMGRLFQCEGCEVGGTWKDQPLMLQIDHINADTLDNRPENLRFLCPNCHSQTETWGSRNRKQYDIVVCVTCGCQIRRGRQLEKALTKQRKTGPYCESCIVILRSGTAGNKLKIVWPSKSELKQLLLKMPATELATTLGVTSTAIKKHCKKLGVETPPRGYWAAQQKRLRNIPETPNGG